MAKKIIVTNEFGSFFAVLFPFEEYRMKEMGELPHYSGIREGNNIVDKKH